MADRPPVPAPNLAEKREQTIQALIRSFAADQLAVEDFESRLDRAHRARDAAALDVLTADLARQEAPADSKVPAPRRPAAPPPAAVRERQTLAAVLGGVERKGAWTPARRTFAVAVMGGVHLDFREAALGPGVTEVDIFAMMGGTEIIVPPGVVVDSDGVAILGGWEHGPGNPTGDPDAPVLRVTGLTLLGGVEIKVREPGESARDAHRRRRAERRERRRQRRIGDGG